MHISQLKVAAKFGGRIAITTLLLGLASAGQELTTARADGGPSIDKTSVHIGVYRSQTYWPGSAKDRQFETWSWVPKMEFRVNGPVDSGSSFVVDFTKPDGSPWLQFDCPTRKIGVGFSPKIEIPRDDSDDGARKYILGTGVFGFKIRLKNELSGLDQPLFAGKFKVAKFHKGLAQFPKHFEYYVDNDWELPIGQVWVDSKHDEKAPLLRVSMWFKGQVDSATTAAYIYYKGNQIGSTAEVGGYVNEEVNANTPGDDPGDPKWTQIAFGWAMVKMFNHHDRSTQAGNVTYLDKSPGDYEVKVLRNGKLSRDVKFTVGDDGNVVDNGVATSNNMGTTRILVPVKVLGTFDGNWQPMAWQADAFYGNPLTGFTP